ncbi:40S ribosomal protein S8 [Tympanuchus pallidicinctus]|uniref:40S ribosomal protein S8 n=1 Tax=Tympanuchus pallidicinctus TaxID=109042 RepID=UPI002286E380|nr:40S ribosomal protein S8 [Tympanuchus pallidicinctus]
MSRTVMTAADRQISYRVLVAVLSLSNGARPRFRRDNVTASREFAAANRPVILCTASLRRCCAMGISRDNWHKRRKTGGKRKPYHKKRKYELGRPPANTKIGPRRIHTVRVRGGNKKYRALRLDVGNFSWGSECCTRKTRIIDVVYNASNNELVRTKTLVKNCIVLVDSTPYRQWYEAHYALPLGRKKGAKLTPEEEEILNKKRSKKIQKKYDERKKNAKIASILEEQFQQGKLLACIASRPGQCGRADGYVLEGKELEFYLRKIKARKGK